MSPRLLHIKTLGCQMNTYDSDRMAGLLAATHGLELTPDPAAADVLLLNTCAIRERAQDKVYSELGVWRELKQARPDVVIGVGGCVASQEGEALRERAPVVDLVFGPQTLHRLPALLNQVHGRRHAGAVDVSFPEIEKFDHLPPPRASGPTAFVTIMEGCSKYCSFCVVPYTRGEEWSRPVLDVLTEVAVLAGQGVREVTLLGQNVNAYRGAGPDGEQVSFAQLLAYVAEIEDIARIRYTTSHPLEFGDDLVRAHADIPKLAPQVHLPVQSGSDRILRAMKRGHTREQYLHRIRQLREAVPGLVLSSDFIVGFPGEDADDFDATLALFDAVGFESGYAFLYSPRPGTPAAELDDGVPGAVKRERLATLMARMDARNAAALNAEVSTPPASSASPSATAVAPRPR